MPTFQSDAFPAGWGCEALAIHVARASTPTLEQKQFWMLARPYKALELSLLGGIRNLTDRGRTAGVMT